MLQPMFDAAQLVPIRFLTDGSWPNGSDATPVGGDNIPQMISQRVPCIPLIVY